MKISNYTIPIIVFFVMKISLNAAYLVDITAIEINQKTIKKYENIVISDKDVIAFKYILRNDSADRTSPFMYKLILKHGDEVSERTVGAKEVLYSNLTDGDYVFEISAFDLAGKWKSDTNTISFKVNNKLAYLIKKIDTLENLKQSADSTIKALENSINTDKNWQELSWKIIYSCSGAALIFLILFIVFLIKGKKKEKIIGSLNSKIDDNSTKMLTIQNKLNKSCDPAEMEKIKMKLENVTKRLESITEINASFLNNVNAAKYKSEEMWDLQKQKNNIFKEILSGVSTPTNIIKGLVELLRSYDLNSNDINDIVNNIIEYTYKIIDQAEDIQRFIDLEDNNVALIKDIVDIDNVVDTAIKKNISDANNKNINLTKNVSPNIKQLEADSQKLIVILHNLINNAIKFTNPNGNVKVNVYETNDKKVHFEVADDGIGIDVDKLQKIYKNFSAEHNLDVIVSPDSTVGLLIVKKYVEAHNSKVRVSSMINNGSTFSFDIM